MFWPQGVALSVFVPPRINGDDFEDQMRKGLEQFDVGSKFRDRRYLKKPWPPPFAVSGSKIPHGLGNFLPCTAVTCPFPTFPASNLEIQARQLPDRVRYSVVDEFDSLCRLLLPKL